MGSRWGAFVAFVAALLLPLALAGPARAGFGIVYPEGPDPAVAEWPSWPDPVSCGGLSFDPVAAFAGETGAEDGTGPPELALRKYLDEALSPQIPKRFWRLIAASGTRVEFAQGRLSQGPFRLAFELLGEQWRPVGLPGYCVPRTVREGSEGVHWGLDRSQTLGPNTRRVKVNLQAGNGCDGGRSLKAAAQKPVFRQFGTRLVMTIWVEPLPPGLYTCKKRIDQSMTVKLPGRLGQRSLFDGATYPPRLRQ